MGPLRDRPGGTGGWHDGYCLSGCGTVFRLDPSGDLTVLADMGTGQAIGSDPQSGLILDHDGNLYGVATGGYCKTNGDCGTVFEIVP
jgi:uncharacterized repeat protein (TIGR03803 family)